MDVSEESDGSVNDVAVVKKAWGRPSKKSHKKQKHGGSGVMEDSPVAKKSRGRPKKVDDEEGRARPKKRVSYVEILDDEDCDASSVPAKHRGRPKKVVTATKDESDEDDEPDEDEDDEPRPVTPKGRGRPKKIVVTKDEDEDDEPRPAPKGRGRPKKVVTATKDESEDDEPEEDEDDEPRPVSPKGRGRPKKKAASQVKRKAAVLEPSRSTSRVTKNIVYYSDSSDSELSEEEYYVKKQPTGKRPVKKGRGRPKKVDSVPHRGRGRPKGQTAPKKQEELSSDSGDDDVSEYTSSELPSSDDEYVKSYEKSDAGKAQHRGKKKDDDRTWRVYMSKKMPKKKTKGEKVLITCVQCDQEVDSGRIQYHMLRYHHLVRSIKHPEGVADVERVIKVLGKVTCKDCEQIFSDFSVYESHLESCKGELMIGPQKKQKPEVELPISCVHCDYSAEKLNKIKYHMIKEHHRTWKLTDREGEVNHETALKALGKLKCFKCQSSFRGLLYFTKHIKECTGEPPQPRGRKKKMDCDKNPDNK